MPAVSIEPYLSPAALSIGLTKLPEHVSTFLWSFLAFTFIYLVIAPFVSQKLFPDTYGKMDKKAKRNWCAHVVSQVHVVVVVPLALSCLRLEGLRTDRAYGWSEERIGTLTAISSGYFLWDALEAISNWSDIGFVIHGLACLSVYMLSFKPFVAYYTARCLLWEASTFFLNIHWFLDKTNRTGSTLQLINGLCLLSTFFAVRLVYGGIYISYNLAHTLYAVRNDVPVIYLLVFGGGDIVLQGLNWLWFRKIIAAVHKRFSKQPVA
ncbi:DUF887-domain-containing protein [Armillaria nabsnona]|nr:DUF887-domain-containing protein [Armillaria nabsnona]